MRAFVVAGFGLSFVALAGFPARADAVIKTLSAIYGTPSAQRTCDATAAVAAACDGKTSCGVIAGNALCWDPDYGTPKTLDIEYQCGPAVARSVTASEQSMADLSCE